MKQTIIFLLDIALSVGYFIWLNSRINKLFSRVVACESDLENIDITIHKKKIIFNLDHSVVWG